MRHSKQVCAPRVLRACGKGGAFRGRIGVRETSFKFGASNLARVVKLSGEDKAEEIRQKSQKYR